MPCKNPCRLYIHRAFANFNRLLLSPQWECLKCNGHEHSISCVKWSSVSSKKTCSKELNNFISCKPPIHRPRASWCLGLVTCDFSLTTLSIGFSVKYKLVWLCIKYRKGVNIRLLWLIEKCTTSSVISTARTRQDNEATKQSKATFTNLTIQVWEGWELWLFEPRMNTDRKMVNNLLIST